MTNPLTPEITPEQAASVRSLRAKGMLWSDISPIVGIPVPLCISLYESPEWPKLVTRIDEDGARFVRCP